MLRDPGYTRDLELLDAQIKLNINEDGSLRGYVGGYRPWRPVYDGWVYARGPVIESLTWVELPSVYYALKREADYSPAGCNGERTHISYALRVDALPAYVVTPDASQIATEIRSYKSEAPEPPVIPRGSLGRIRVIDGIVVDPRAENQPGPDAVILPPE